MILKFKRADNTRYGKRHKPGVMNRTETEYADILAACKTNGSVIDFQFEAMTFKLADGCRYTPDFAVWLSDGTMEFYDCKGAGPMDDKSRVKIKCCADKFPQFDFFIAQKQTKKNGGGWKVERF